MDNYIISNSKNDPGRTDREPKSTVARAGAGSFRKKPKSNKLLDPEIEFLFCDSSFCVVNKPAGVPSQTQSNENDILTLVAKALNKPQDRLHLVNRLDQPVSGLMIIAFSKKAHASFEFLRQNGDIRKYYLAVTTNVPAASSGSLQDHLLRNARKNKSEVVSAGSKGSKEARLNWHKLAQAKDNEGHELALLLIRLDTGRHHQIRVQLANAGWPIYGDRKYGQDLNPINENIALLSYKLEFHHPVTGKEISLRSNLPDNYPFSLFGSILSLDIKD